MVWATKRKTGFTIVELLIVIVVIGILAAVILVAYNGIQKRAQQSVAQNTVKQANTKILAYAAQNSDQYPPNLDAAGIPNDDGLLQYSVDYNASPPTYGLTATAGSYSYFMSNTTTQPTSGGYKGHGRGGVAAITNLMVNPSMEIVVYSANNGSSSSARSTAMAYSGVSSDLVTSLSTTNGYNGVVSGAPVTAGKTYTLSGWVYLNGTYGAGIAATTNGAGTGVKQGNVITATGSWQRTSVSFTPTTTGNASLYFITPNGSTASVGASFYVDAVMFTEGADVPTYADGNSPDWIWKGGVNNSSSVGPAL